jgi:inorganic phosphate transporter, PiT family
LPVSSTHIAVGGVFGVGFLREYLKVSYARMLEEIRFHHQTEGSSPDAVEAFIARFEKASVDQKGHMLRELKRKSNEKILYKGERKGLGRLHSLELVKRSLLLMIAAAWVITVPLAGTMAAMIFFMIRGILVP